MLTRLLIILIGLLIPASKPCIDTVSQWHGDTVIKCLSTLPQLEPKLKFANRFFKSSQISDLLSLISELKPFITHLPILLGQTRPVTYLVLLQNDYEMRANGGFFGSYAVVSHTPSLSPPSQGEKCSSLPCKGEGLGWGIRFQDIYVPDGQIKGHVDPPAPIQAAFKQGWFRLRDSDWEADFPTAATTIRWFFDKGNEINPDFLVTLNLSTIKQVLATVGEVEVPGFNFSINQDNLYSLLQNQTEIGFFPGSTQKHDILTATGKALFNKLLTLNPKQYLAIANILINQLKHGNLLVNSQDPSIQNTLLEQNWAGQISNVKCKILNCINDTYLLVEANLGANKANCCVDRSSIHTITRSTPSVAKGEVGSIQHSVNITFTNNSLLENPSPPRFFGGNYISYLRFYIPKDATNIHVSASPTLSKTLTDYPKPFSEGGQGGVSILVKYSLTEVGFFHLTAAGTKSTINLSYDLPLNQNYQLSLLKQHGLDSSPSQISLFGKNFSTDLTNDYLLTSSL